MGWSFGLLGKVRSYYIVKDGMGLWVAREGAELFQWQRFGWSFGLLGKVRSYSIVKDGMGLWLAG